MGWEGVNQSNDWEHTCYVAKVHIDLGRQVRISSTDYGEGDKEHSGVEYEVWALFDDGGE